MPHPAPLRRPVSDWSDLDAWLNQYVAQQYVPVLIQFAGFIEDATRINLDVRKSDRKDSTLHKVKEGFKAMMKSGNFQTYQQVRMRCENAGRDVHTWSYGYVPPPTFGGVPAASSSLSAPSAGKLNPVVHSHLAKLADVSSIAYRISVAVQLWQPLPTTSTL